MKVLRAALGAAKFVVIHNFVLQLDAD